MNRKSSYYIRVLAGGYLLYLGYSLFKATVTDHLSAIYLIFGIVFAILGVIIGGSALWTIYRIEKEEREGGGEQQMQENTEEQENLLQQEDVEEQGNLLQQEDAEEENLLGQEEKGE